MEGRFSNQLRRPAWRLVLRGSLLLLLGAASCNAPERRDDAAAALGRIDAVQGEAWLLRGARRSAAMAGATVEAGDRVGTGDPGKMRIVLADDSLLAIGASSQLDLRELELDERHRSGRLAVLTGRFWLQVSKWTGKGESFVEVETPNAVAGVRGTTLWGDTDVDAICSLEGRVEVHSRIGASPATVLEAGHCASRLRQGILEPMTPTPQQLEAYLGEVRIR